MSETQIKVLSPIGKSPMVYNLSSNDEDDVRIQIKEIIQTIKLVSEDLPTVQESLEELIKTNSEEFNIENIQLICEKYNRLIKCILVLENGTSLINQRINKYPSVELLRHILQLTYNKSIDNPHELNQYQPFSATVYGELSYDFVKHMIEKTQLTSNDIFIDLGSGVGQVVLQIAASVHCEKCYGIEIDQTRSKYAEIMSDNFKRYLEWFGKTCGKYELINGNFLDKEHRELITKATVILVNNLCLGPAIDNKLKEIFINLKDGTKLISSKNFGPLNRYINDRNYQDISAIVDITKLLSPEDSFSWTSKCLPYFLHVINHSKVDNFWDKIKKPYFKRCLINHIQKRYKIRKTQHCSNCKKYFVESEKTDKPKTETTCDEAPNVAPVDMFMNNLKILYQNYIEQMKSPNYKELVESLINVEQEKNRQLKEQIKKLEDKIDTLTNTGVSLLELRLRELDIEPTPNDLIATSIELTEIHKRLKSTVQKLDLEMSHLETEYKRLVDQQVNNILLSMR